MQLRFLLTGHLKWQVMCKEKTAQVGIRYRACRSSGSNCTPLLKAAKSTQVQIRLETPGSTMYYRNYECGKVSENHEHQIPTCSGLNTSFHACSGLYRSPEIYHDKSMNHFSTVWIQWNEMLLLKVRTSLSTVPTSRSEGAFWHIRRNRRMFHDNGDEAIFCFRTGHVLLLLF
jgi:hypothetical protein